MRLRIALAVSLLLNLGFLVFGLVMFQKRGGSTRSAREQEYYAIRSRAATGHPSTVFMGDSITDNCPWEAFLGPGTLNLGIAGETSLRLLQRAPAVASLRPSRIFLMIGINDLARDSSPRPLLDNVAAILRIIRERSPETKVLIQSILPIDERVTVVRNSQVEAANSGLRSLAANGQIQYLDLYPLFVQAGQIDLALSSDGVHLNGAGEAVWKQAVARHLDK